VSVGVGGGCVCCVVGVLGVGLHGVVSACEDVY